MLGLVVLSNHLTLGLHATKREVVHIHAVTLPKPKPKPLPLPPKPIAKPKPLPPPPPKPVAKPLPKAPPPKPAPKPRPKPTPKPLPRKIVPRAKPTPVAPPKRIVKPVLQPVAHIVPSPSPAEVENALAAYLAILRARVQANLTIPVSIRMLGFSGRARVLIRLAPNGRLLVVSLARSSGIPPIDALALKTVRETSFPRFSAKMPKHPLAFTLGVIIRR